MSILINDKFAPRFSEEGVAALGVKIAETLAVNLLGRTFNRATVEEVKSGVLDSAHGAEIAHKLMALGYKPEPQGKAFAQFARRTRAFYKNSAAAMRLADIAETGADRPFIMVQQAMVWAGEVYPPDELDALLAGAVFSAIIKGQRGELREFVLMHDRNPHNKQKAAP